MHFQMIVDTDGTRLVLTPESDEEKRFLAVLASGDEWADKDCKRRMFATAQWRSEADGWGYGPRGPSEIERVTITKQRPPVDTSRT